MWLIGFNWTSVPESCYFAFSFRSSFVGCLSILCCPLLPPPRCSYEFLICTDVWNELTGFNHPRTNCLLVLMGFLKFLFCVIRQTWSDGQTELRPFIYLLTPLHNSRAVEAGDSPEIISCTAQMHINDYLHFTQMNLLLVSVENIFMSSCLFKADADPSMSSW